MRVRLIKKQAIEAWVVRHPLCRASFTRWISIVKYADWNKPGDVLVTFASADILGNGSNRVVFDIGGNRCRMICKYHFGLTYVHLFIKWIGTHSAYTKICNKGKQFTVSDF